ncbi:hypothetical protein SB847_21545, partial [Bacillus sp. SIMBA_026]
KHMQVPMVPLREEILQDPAQIYDNLVARVDSLDAVFLVDPNNPTGFSLFSLFSPTDHAFREVVRFCVDHDKLLVMDFCFASFIL